MKVIEEKPKDEGAYKVLAELKPGTVWIPETRNIPYALANGAVWLAGNTLSTGIMCINCVSGETIAFVPNYRVQPVQSTLAISLP